MTVASGTDEDRGRRLLLGLQLLDRQIVDREGRLAGKVDDVELTTPDEGGPVGRLAAVLARRLDPEQGDPGRIPLRDVSEIDNHVTVGRNADELTVYTAERAIREGIIGRIPGASDRDVAE